MAKPRNYKREYLLWQSSKKAKLDRAARNRARAQLVAEGKVKKGDGKDVDHHDGNPRNGSRSNLRVMTASANRAKH